MKQIPLLQGKAILIELPEGAKFPRIETDQSVIPYGQDLTWDINGGEKSYWLDETEWVSLPPGNWRIIGMLSEVTEGQAAGLVEYTGLGNGVDRWLNYVNNGDKFTALESLHSSIEAEGWYFENPLENERKKIGLGTLDNFDQDYEQAQSRILDRSRCLLLGREDV